MIVPSGPELLLSSGNCIWLFVVFSGPEMLVVLGLAIFLFGSRKIPDLIGGMRQGINDFRKGFAEEETLPLIEPFPINKKVNSNTCLVVSADPALTSDLTLCARRVFSRITTSMNYDAAVTALWKKVPPLTIIDHELPSGEAIYLISYLQNMTRSSVIIIGNAREGDRESLRLRSSGGSIAGYLVQPFSDQELLALMRGVLRQCDQTKRLPRPVTWQSASTETLPRQAQPIQPANGSLPRAHSEENEDSD